MIVSLLMYISCDNNEYLDPYGFPFEIELNSETKGYTGKEIEISSVFSSKYNASNVDHSYIAISDLAGYILNEKGDSLKTDDWIKYEPNQKFYYKPSVAGEHTLNFKFKNKFGFELIKQKKFVIENSLFQFSASVTSNNASIGVPKLIKLNLKKGDNQPKDTKFTYKFELDGLSGELKNGDEVLEQNKSINISEGVLDLNFISDNTTEDKGGKLYFTATDNFGQQVKSEVILVVGKSSFDFTAGTLNSSILINEEAQINFSVTPFDQVPNTTYKLKFEVEGQNASLNGIQPNTWMNIKEGDFSYIYKGLSVGTHKIKFSVMNNWNSIETKEVIIEVKPYTFNFSAVASSSNVYIQQPLNINFNISPNSGANYQEYQMKYEVVKGSGTLQNYEQGIFQNVSQGNFQISFTPESIGEVSVKFTARNQNGYEVERIVTLDVKTPDFTFNANAEFSNVNIGTTNKIFYSIVNNSSIDQKYQVKYEVLEGEGSIEGLSGEWKDLNLKEGSFLFTAKKSGQIQLKISVKNQFNVIKEQTITVKVNVPTFDFIATSSTTSANVNNPFDVVYTVTYPKEVNQTFRVKYEVVKGSGTVEGLSLNYSDLKNLEGNFKITPKTAEDLEIIFTVINNFDEVKTQKIIVKVLNPSFNFDVIPMELNANVNFEQLANVMIENTSSVDQTYEVKYEVLKGSAVVEKMTVGVFVPYTQGTTQIKFTPKLAESLTIRFTARNNYGVVQTKDITIQVNDPDFVLKSNVIGNSTLEVGNYGEIENEIIDDVSLGMTYQLKASTSGQGVFLYNGVEYQNGQTINISRGVSTLKYKPTGLGGQEHQISLVATNNFNISKNTKVNFTVEIEPKIESFKLERQNKKSNCGGLNGCKYAYDYQISYNIQLPKNERLYSVSIYGQDRNGTYQTKTLSLAQYTLVQDRLMYHNQGFTEKPRPEYWNDSNNNFKITFFTTTGRKLELTNIRMTEYE